MNEPLAEMFRQNLWANLRLLDVCSKLSEEQLEATVAGTRGTIRETLLHNLGADGRYAARLRGTPVDGTVNERTPWTGIEPLKASAKATGEALVQLALAFSEERWLSGSQERRAFRVAASLLLVQAFNHGTEHRSQVNTVLTQLGIEPPALDGWTYGEDTGRFVWE